MFRDIWERLRRPRSGDDDGPTDAELYADFLLQEEAEKQERLETEGMTPEQIVEYHERSIAEMNGQIYLKDADALLAELTDERYIRFHPGKYGRTDIFYLKEKGPSFKTVGEITAWSEEETMSILEKIDQLVMVDRSVSFFADESAWVRTVDDRCGDGLAVPLYRRRLDEQKRILDGEIKRGHKAFGYYPLDGGS